MRLFKRKGSKSGAPGGSAPESLEDEDEFHDSHEVFGRHFTECNLGNSEQPVCTANLLLQYFLQACRWLT